MSKDELREELESVMTGDMEDCLSDIGYDYENFRVFYYAVERWISERGIIYCRNAMEYLSKHDPSLQNSLSLAEDFGYSLSDVDSEILATLHYQNDLMEQWSNVSDDVERIFDDFDTDYGDYFNR